jgi:uncharacterized protein YndB with AHSA1/START domain
MTNATTITANPGEQVVDIDRVLDAPIADVYRAYSEPDLIAQWMGPHGYEMEISKFDLRTGGEWAFTHRNPEGEVFEFRGCYHDIRPRESMTQTFEFLGVPGHVSLERVTFEDLGSSTRVRIHAVYQSVEDRDGIVASGMAMGVTQGFERMDALLAASMTPAESVKS